MYFDYVFFNVIVVGYTLENYNAAVHISNTPNIQKLWYKGKLINVRNGENNFRLMIFLPITSLLITNKT